MEFGEVDRESTAVCEAAYRGFLPGRIPLPTGIRAMMLVYGRPCIELLVKTGSFLEWPVFDAWLRRHGERASWEARR